MENLPNVGETYALSKPVTSNSVSTPQESKGMNNDKVITQEMFRINPFKSSREEKHVPNIIRASDRTKPITVSQPSVTTKKDVNSDVNGLFSTGVDNTKTRRPQPRSNTKIDRVPSASKSSRSQNKEAEVEEHHRNLLLSKNNKHISLISVNHDKCLRNYVNGKNSRGKKQKAKVSLKENKMKYQPKVTKPKKVGTLEILLHLSLENLDFSLGGHQLADCLTKKETLLIPVNSRVNLTALMFMGTVRFGNDHVATILGFGDLQWGNILITRVYFVEGLGHTLFSVGQFCDPDLKVAFRRTACFVRNLEGVDLLKGDCSTNLYTINLHEMASASPICLLKFKYHKEHLCPSCEQGKSKRASHPPKPVPNSRQMLHLLHMDLFGPMRIASINEKRYVLVIVDNYSRYTWVHFLRKKDESPELGAKSDIGFCYSANSCAYKVYNRRTKKIMETMNVSFEELSAMAFEQRSSKPGLNSMTSGQI
nr:hypothetical protein [Tanacetum cinerariifolium]